MSDLDVLASLQVVNTNKDSITVTVNLVKEATKKIRLYIQQCGKEDRDDLARIEFKKTHMSHTATIDLEDIDIAHKSFDIAVYAKEHDKIPISNTVTLSIKNDEILLDDEEDEKYNLLDTVITNSDDSESDYENMYSQPIEYKDVQLKKQSEQKLALEVSEIKCDEISCRKTFTPANVFFCAHLECQDDNNIYCAKCMRFKHDNKLHKFDPNKVYIKSIQGYIQDIGPNQAEFDNKKAKGVIFVKVSEVEKFLWHHRWSLGVLSQTLFATVKNKIEYNRAYKLSMEICPYVADVRASKFIDENVLANAVTGVGAATVGTLLESIFIWRQFIRKRISKEEALALTGISFAGYCAPVVGWISVMTLGVVTGYHKSKLTTVATVAAILFGLSTRYGLNKWFEDTFMKKNNHDVNQELQQLALKYFFNDENYDINNKQIFSDKILRKKYHGFALTVHPDRHSDNMDEWLKLSGYYGILIGIWEEKYLKDEHVSTKEHLSEEQRSLLMNTSLKNFIQNN